MSRAVSRHRLTSVACAQSRYSDQSVRASVGVCKVGGVKFRISRIDDLKVYSVPEGVKGRSSGAIGSSLENVPRSKY